MFEINLVPNIKAEMLRKQRMANLVLFISIVVAAASAGIVLIFGSIVGGQNIAMADQDNEISCRSDGIPRDAKGKEIPNSKICEKTDSKGNLLYGTAVLKVANVNDFLTIQDQMSRLEKVNSNKMLLSRVFGVLDVLLPPGPPTSEELVEVSELTVDLTASTLTFEAQGNSESNIDYRALEVFEKSAASSYYDFGRYYRTDEEGSPVVIPTMCITEKIENGVIYGEYSKGKAGCEAPLIPGPEVEQPNPEGENPEAEPSATPAVTTIRIRRTYTSSQDIENYKTENKDNDGGYYFESACIQYEEGGEGAFDEDATLLECPLISSEIVVRESSNGEDVNNKLVLRFAANVSVSANIFKFINKHMRIVGPSRQNVTDSYTQIRDMFAEKAADCDPSDEQCAQTEVPENGN